MRLATDEWERMKSTDSRECRNCHNFEAMSGEVQKQTVYKKHMKAKGEGGTCTGVIVLLIKSRRFPRRWPCRYRQAAPSVSARAPPEFRGLIKASVCGQGAEGRKARQPIGKPATTAVVCAVSSQRRRRKPGSFVMMRSRSGQSAAAMTVLTLGPSLIAGAIAA